jgi:hypothetical protein
MVSDLSCSDYDSFVTETLWNARREVQFFEGGRLAFFLDEWRSLTKDQSLIQAVRGYRIPFATMPKQVSRPKLIHFSEQEKIHIDIEIESLLRKRVILRWSDENEIGFVSNIFTRLKQDGTYRVILNLSLLNECVEYRHFKMSSIHTILHMMTPGCYMASVDIKDAYYSVPIHDKDIKYLVFCWKSEFYAFRVFPNGLAPCPRVFTHLMKPVLHSLRAEGWLSVSYIDDFYLQGDSLEECQNNVRHTTEKLQRLGFVVHPEKSVLNPTRTLKVLGFLVNSLTMTVGLPSDKSDGIVTSCRELISSATPTIRRVSQVIGSLVDTQPAVSVAPLFIHQLEIDKNSALRVSKGNFDRKMRLSKQSIKDLWWWVDNVQTMSSAISRGGPNKTIFTDASNIGFGYTCNGISGGCQWSAEEKTLHINCKELKAILFGLMALCKDVSNQHIRIMTDNMTCVSYVNKFGGTRSPRANDIAREIWNWALNRNIWLSAAHIPARISKRIDAVESFSKKQNGC